MRTPEQLAAEVSEAVRSDPVAYALVVKAALVALVEMAHEATQLRTPNSQKEEGAA